MAEITTLLYAELLVPLASFLVGVLFGWIMRGLVAQNRIKINLNSFVQFIIISLWSFSVVRGLIDVDYSTPKELNIFMGVVLGAMNENVGRFILALWKQKK